MGRIKLLVLRVTERCNLQCAYCYAARGEETIPDMDEAMALRAVELCCPQDSTLRIQFTGGEPLLRLDLMEAVAAFGKRTGRKLVLSVQTNGTLLTPQTCFQLRAIQCGVGVSLDGMGDANSLRTFPDGTGSCGAVLQGIRNLGEAGMRCGLTAVVTSVNAERLGQLADLALFLGNVAGVGLDLFRPLGRGNGRDLSPDPDTLTHGLEELKTQTERLRQAGIHFRFRELDRLQKRQSAHTCGGAYCYAQTDFSLALDGRGDWWPCSSFAGQESSLLGNIRDGLPHGICFAAEIAAPERCRQCGSFSTCLGGCPARRYQTEVPDNLNCVMHRVLSDDQKRGAP